MPKAFKISTSTNERVKNISEILNKKTEVTELPSDMMSFIDLKQNAKIMVAIVIRPIAPRSTHVCTNKL